MMEALFDELTRAYPDGSMSFAFQVYDELEPTDRFVRFTRKTDTVEKDYKEVAYDDKTRIAVNLISLLLTLFPPTAPLGIGLGLIYNGYEVLSELDDALRTDTLTTSKVVDVGLLALDILPVVGALSKTARIGKTTYHLIEATQLTGSVYLLADGVQAGIVDLRDRLINRLAEKHQELARIRQLNPSSPEAAQLALEIRGLESDVRAAAKEVFTKVVASQGLQLASQSVVRHLAGGILTRPDADTGTDGTPHDAPPPADGSGTRGADVYQLQKVGELQPAGLKSRLSNLEQARRHARYHSRGELGGQLKVDVEGGHRIVDVEYVLVPELDKDRGHDGNAGPGEADIKPPDSPGGHWQATIRLSSQLRKRDVGHVIGHELDEVIEVVRRYEKDPSIDIKSEQQANLFRPGAPHNAHPTAHDVAAARELDALFESARVAREKYGQAMELRRTQTGGSVSATILANHKNEVLRLHRKLVAMGFDDGSDPRARIDVATREAAHPQELRAFIEQYKRDPGSQLPDEAAATKRLLLDAHETTLGALGVGKDLAQSLVDKGVAGTTLIDVANHGGPEAVLLLARVVESSREIDGAVALVKRFVEDFGRGSFVDRASPHIANLRRFAVSGTNADDVMKLFVKPERTEHIEAISWLTGHPESTRRLRHPDALRTLGIAERKQVLPQVERLISSGKLDNPKSLAKFLEELPSSVTHYGNRLSLDVALERASHSDGVVLEGRRGDVEIRKDTPVVIQAKALSSTTAQAFNNNVYSAISQLRGERGEEPLPGSIRIVVIQLPPSHDLENESKQGFIESLRSMPVEYSSLIREPDHGWDEIEIRTLQHKLVITPKDISP